MIVDVAAVEQELTRIQRELTSSEVRTSLFNLVIFSPDAEHEMGNSALNFLLGKRAARVIHLSDARTGESRLDVSARCFIDAERKSVCFQEIIITIGVDGTGGAPGTWVPLLVRDIPTFVIWLDAIRSKHDLLTRAVEQADKVLLDTQRSVALGDLPEDVLGIARDIAIGRGIPVTDFAFKRLRPLQRLVAAAFDAPERTPLLEEVSAVRLRGQQPVAARLISLWLADRLGWTASGDKFLDRRGRPVVFSHTATADCVFGVRFELTNGENISVESRLAGCADVDYPEGSELHPITTVAADGELLLEEVDAIASDALYRNALAVLGGPEYKAPG